MRKISVDARSLDKLPDCRLGHDRLEAYPTYFPHDPYIAGSRWRPPRWLLASGFAIACTRTASAHPSGLQAGDAWWWAWYFDPLIVFHVMILSLCYARGLVRLRRRAGKGKVLAAWRAWAFGLSMLSIVIALMSPLDTLSDDLSWVHMTQHMVLMLIAAPLLVVSAPGLVVAWALPRSWRSALGKLFCGRNTFWGRTTHQLVWNSLWIWSLHAFVLWVWHIPWLYELALVDPLVHDLEHLSFFLVACLFWRVVIDRRRHPTLNPGWSVLYLFTTSLHATVLGVFMALAPSVWYPTYMDRTWRWGLSPLEDQQLAGLIMWMPACTVYAVVAAGLFANWLQELDGTPAGHGKHLPCTET